MPPSPVPGVTLEGYPQEISVPAGAPAHLMVSGSAGEAELRIVRLVHGDPNPAGPGYRDEAVDWGVPATVEIAEQVLDKGSYVEVPAKRGPPFPESFTLTMWARPTMLTGDWQALFALWGAEAVGFGVFATGSRTLTAGVSRDGRTVEWCTGGPGSPPEAGSSWRSRTTAPPACCGSRKPGRPAQPSRLPMRHSI